MTDCIERHGYAGSLAGGVDGCRTGGRQGLSRQLGRKREGGREERRERGEEPGGLDRKVDAALLRAWFLPTVVVIASIGYLAVRPSKPDPIHLSIYDPPIRHQSQAVRCARQRPANND